MTGIRTGRLAFAAASVAFAFAAYSSVAAQPPAATAAATPGWKGKNLKVFAADIPREQLLGAMRSFTAALGVKCTHCHAGEEGKLDFASDAKKEKLIARSMLEMVHRINADEFKVKNFKDVKVTCFTCHRGALKPLTAPPPAQPGA